MALAFSPEIIAAINSGYIANAWLLDLYTDEGVLRCWDKERNASVLGGVYEGLSDSFAISGEIRLGSDLVPEPLVFTFDASPENDSGSFVGRLVDRQWHQRPIRMRGVLFQPGQDFITLIGSWIEWNGTMDTMEFFRSNRYAEQDSSELRGRDFPGSGQEFHNLHRRGSEAEKTPGTGSLRISP